MNKTWVCVGETHGKPNRFIEGTNGIPIGIGDLPQIPRILYETTWII